MGKYLRGPTTGKADHLIRTEGAIQIERTEVMDAFDEGKGVICVVQYPTHDAAGFMDTAEELADWLSANKWRTEIWLTMDINRIKELI